LNNLIINLISSEHTWKELFEQAPIVSVADNSLKQYVH